MGTIEVRLNDREQKVFEDYAERHGIPLSSMMKQALEERIEDELDLESVKSYEADVQNNNVTVYDYDETKQMLDL
ncbi:hypothetical protein J4760_12875 [Salinicoccus sp. ID82-1]|uniref:type II toxin-antitoxin system RelB family antitoxin n=1 Tax=Salinicoccus sp. ID82-1 TaxID=2820269 RepID=UPI001F3B13B5|nr:DUF6290 family protein [Salinicoccus sp. ID82-1]MCG1010915.1 hypothetical protein [Salinicoccus sp. ID82-1]